MAALAIEFDDGSRIQAAPKPDTAGALTRPASCSIDAFYDIDATALFLRECGALRVALQFPDELLPEAPEVLWSLQTRLAAQEPEPLLFITGDTSYGSCCVDEISAQHLGADGVVHYGRACLTPTAAAVPVWYVFGRGEIDIGAVAAQVKDSGMMQQGRLVVVYETAYAHCTLELKEALQGDGSVVIVGEARPRNARASQATPPATAGGSAGQCCGRSVPGMDAATGVSGSPSSCCSASDSRPDGCCGGTGGGDEGVNECYGGAALGRGCGYEAVIAEGEGGAEGSTSYGDDDDRCITVGGLSLEVTEEELKDSTVLYLGREGLQLSNVLMRCAYSKACYSLDPATGVLREESVGPGANKALKRRYYLIQKAREASIIGVVIGTLGVQHFNKVVDSVQSAIENAGKQAYVFAVGKVNPAKLANFAEVEVFCLIACPENSILDSGSFHAPVITPFELQIALGERDWSEFYSTDFGDLSLGHPPEGAIGEEEDDKPFYSLVSGSFVSKTRTKASTPAENSDTDIGASTGAVVQFSSAAGSFLQGREFQGLEGASETPPAAPAIEGSTGIASSYQAKP